jgi:hypothetical protein
VLSGPLRRKVPGYVVQAPAALLAVPEHLVAALDVDDGWTHVQSSTSLA